MVVKVSGGSGGSCGGLVEYLEKQERGQWFSGERDGLTARDVAPALDANKRNLGREDEKFYQVIISPSREELRHVGCDPARLREYTRGVMEQYAQNFGKGLESRDLVWFAKIEHERSQGPGDRAVQLGEATKGKKKEGEQTHVHVLVSRTENLRRFAARQQAGELERKHPLKLSPATNHRETSRGAVRGGFDRTAFIRASEQEFDRRFTYRREQTETFDFSRTQQHGSPAERVAQRLAVIRAETTQRERERRREQYTEQAERAGQRAGPTPAQRISPGPTPQKEQHPEPEEKIEQKIQQRRGPRL